MKRPKTDQLWTAIDEYLADCLVPGDDALEAALAASAAAGCRRSTWRPIRASC